MIKDMGTLLYPLISTQCKTIFWDFDGVIKESVDVKSDAFEELFLPFDRNVSKKIRLHHEANVGMSRFEKIPLYLEWANQEPITQLVEEYVNKFAVLVKQKVVDSYWVDGVLDYLVKNYEKQIFFLVTATPQEEIKAILSQLKIEEFFKQVVGSPTHKKAALKLLITKHSLYPKKAVMIGDSIIDYEAAKANQVKFILRKTKLNNELQEQLDCMIIDNFL